MKAEHYRVAYYLSKKKGQYRSKALPTRFRTRTGALFCALLYAMSEGVACAEVRWYRPGQPWRVLTTIDGRSL